MGDFNGDGHQDLAFVNFNKDEQSVFIYFNDGAGDFSRDGRQVLSREDLKLAKSGKDDRRKNGGMHTLLATRLNDDAIDDLIVAQIHLNTHRIFWIKNCLERAWQGLGPTATDFSERYSTGVPNRFSTSARLSVLNPRKSDIHCSFHDISVLMP